MHRIYLPAILTWSIAVIGLTSVVAEPVTSSRVNELPAVEQPAWKAYLERSQASAQADQAAVQAEVDAQKLTNALRAPSGGDFKLPAKMDNVWNASDEAKQLADAVLSYQTPSGGWSNTHRLQQRPAPAGHAMEFAVSARAGAALSVHVRQSFDH